MQVFSVLSYNIHECVGSDRRRNPARIAEVINRSGAQIIGLQEVHSDASGTEELHQMNYLAAATGLQAIPGPAVERRNGHYGNVLLTSYKVLAVHNLNLSYPGREPRGAIDAELEIGDFNEWLPTGRSLRWIHTRLGKTALVRTFPAAFPLFALDRIWVSPAAALVKVSRVRTPLTRVASDHLPLKGVIQSPAFAPPPLL